MFEQKERILPREIIKWLDKLELGYQIVYPRRDLANGYIVGCILSRLYPEVSFFVPVLLICVSSSYITYTRLYLYFQMINWSECCLKLDK